MIMLLEIPNSIELEAPGVAHVAYAWRAVDKVRRAEISARAMEMLGMEVDNSPRQATHEKKFEEGSSRDLQINHGAGPSPMELAKELNSASQPKKSIRGYMP